MPVYGTGEYNEIDYGRIDARLFAAQNEAIRTSGLRVKVLDTHINDWSYIAGTGLDTFAVKVDGVSSFLQTYYIWRLKMGMCVLSNGTIVRVRCGDGTVADRNIYKQEITDPTSASQWTSWTLAYSGTHYAVAVAPATASTYYIYAAKSDGIYKNNTLKRSVTGVIDIIPVQGQTDAMFITKIFEDTLDHQRVMDIAYSGNIETTNFADDVMNYRWLNSDMSALKLDDGRVARVQVAAFFADPRSFDLAESMVICFQPSTTSNTINDPPRLIRGFAGQAGSNSIRQPFLTKLSDGFYYLFYSEVRWDASKDNAISLATLFWQRSKDLLHWTEPVAIGFDNMAPTNVAAVELSSYVYLANNGAVWRRPTTTTEYDVSNYVTGASLEVAKNLEEGAASITIANPNGVHDAIKNLTDYPITIEVGLLCADGTYQYVEFGEWWIDRVEQTIDYKINRLTVVAYDISRRMANPLRDVYNFAGQVQWIDWYLGRRNKLFNYYIRGGKATWKITATNVYFYVYRIQRSQWALYTGWKGHNFDFTLRYRPGTIPQTSKWGIIYRYKDSKNYYWAQIYNKYLYLRRVRDGVNTNLASYNIGSNLTNPKLRVIAKFGFHYVYLNDVLRISHNESVPSVYPGYVGTRYYSPDDSTYGADLFSLTTWETPYTTDELVKTALSMADLHDYVVAAGGANQLAIVWGPQTDLNSPAAALQSLLTQHKLQLTWRNGTINVGQFKEVDPIRTIENSSLEFKLTEVTGRRINLASVDGQEDSYIAIDGADTRARGRQIVAYFDIPELVTTESVVDRANEEIRKGTLGVEWEGKTRTYFDLWKLDVINWVDNGVTRALRIEAFTVEIDQGVKPKQETSYTLSPAT